MTSLWGIIEKVPTNVKYTHERMTGSVMDGDVALQGRKKKAL
jgi:hypothetical protein